MNMFARTKIAIATAFMVFLAACASAPAPTPTVAPTPVAVEATADAAPLNTASIADGYKLGNADRLRITVFGEPTLSGEFVVDGTGQISLPLIGEIHATGKTVREVQREYEGKLKDGYLNSPRVSAEVIDFRPYYILGEVGRPGEYPYQDGLTVLNAVATAGGFSYRANKKTVFVRGANATEEVAVPLTSSTQVTPGDTIRIGERLF